MRRILSDVEASQALAAMRAGDDPREVASRFGIGLATAYRLRAGTGRPARAAHHAALTAEVAARRAEREETP